MSAHDAIIRGALKTYLAEQLPDYAKKYLAPGLAGDVDAAASLVSAAPPRFRGYIAVAAYYLGTANPAYRTILGEVWSLSHEFVVRAANGNRGVRRLMKEARFPHPFSGEIIVYRGVGGVTPRTATQGLSWTTSRDVACWFALRSAHGARMPIVMAATVDASKVVFYDNERAEEEVICSHAISGVFDSDPTTWREAMQRYESAIRGDVMINSMAGAC